LWEWTTEAPECEGRPRQDNKCLDREFGQVCVPEWITIEGSHSARHAHPQLRSGGAALHKVFQQALANIRRFEWRGVPFVAWLYRIAANAIADRSARSAREQGEAVEEVADESAMREVEARAALYEMVRGLASDQQRVIVARFVEEKSIREIAQELGRSEGAVKQLQFRALENLRKRMEGANG
jgi:RNA polymerase sigma-70 factor (ECF subfamily)